MTYFSIVLAHKLLDGDLLIFVNKYKQNLELKLNIYCRATSWTLSEGKINTTEQKKKCKLVTLLNLQFMNHPFYQLFDNFRNFYSKLLVTLLMNMKVEFYQWRLNLPLH